MMNTGIYPLKGFEIEFADRWGVSDEELEELVAQQDSEGFVPANAGQFPTPEQRIYPSFVILSIPTRGQRTTNLTSFPQNARRAGFKNTEC